MSDPCAITVDGLGPVVVVQERYAIGSVVAGKYRLEAQLGQGGMGTVWLALNLALEARIALKVIHPDMQREEVVERLLLEARVEAGLRHPNILQVFDFGQTELGDAFIVMELLEGVTLGQLMEQRGRLEAAEAVQIALPVVAALCHAHAAGVVHRDIKPDNIFLDRSGPNLSPKVFDFGVAKLTRSNPHHHRTERGIVIGSLAYMAPEQAQGLADVDERADIWAICVVLYEAISGELAFPGEGYTLLRSVIEGDLVPLRELCIVDDVLSQIISRGLEKDRARRFQSMHELGTALAQWLYDGGAREDLDGNRISRAWPIVEDPADASAEARDHGLPRDPTKLRIPVPGAGHNTTPWYASERRTTGALRASFAALAMIAMVAIPTPLHKESLPSMQRKPSDVAVAAESGSGSPASARFMRSDLLLTKSTVTTPAHDSSKHDPSESESATRAPTEAELGLKVPY